MTNPRDAAEILAKMTNPRDVAGNADEEEVPDK